MSRIGRSPVFFDKTVQITITPDNVVVIKGQKVSEKVTMRKAIQAKIDGNQVILTRKSDDNATKALHGVYRSLIQNAVIGVTKGFTKTLELVGVGYRANVKGKILELTVGFSHQINFDIPDGIEIKVEKQTTIVVAGASKEKVGQVAANIRAFRPPEPFLGKGIKYSDEVIRRKAGKAAGK